MCHTTILVSTLADDGTSCNDATVPSTPEEGERRKSSRQQSRESRSWGRSTPLPKTRKAARSWGRSAPPPPLHPTRSEGHFLPMAIRIDEEVAAELEGELANLQSKTKSALEASYAEVDRQRRENDRAAGSVRSLEGELERLAEEKEERNRAPRPAVAHSTLKIMTRPLARRWSDLVSYEHGSSNDSIRSLVMPTGRSRRASSSVPIIRKSCTLFLEKLQTEQEAISCACDTPNNNNNETTETATLANRLGSLEVERKTRMEKLNDKLVQMNAAEADLLSILTRNSQVLKTIRSEIGNIRSRRNEASSKARSRSLPMQEECAKLSSGIEMKARLLQRARRQKQSRKCDRVERRVLRKKGLLPDAATSSSAMDHFLQSSPSLLSPRSAHGNSITLNQ